METKFFKCTNPHCKYNIENDGNEFVLTESEFPDKNNTGKYICPTNPENSECGLIEVDPSTLKGPDTPINIKLIAAIALGILLIGGLVFFFVNKAPDEKLLTDSTIAKIDIPTEAPVDEPVEEEQVQEPEPSISLETSPSNISFSKLLQKIGNSKIPYSDKDVLKNQLIENYFKNDEAQVIEIGMNNTEVGHTAIKDFLEELSQQNYSFEILEVIPKSQKNIKTIKIRRN